MISGRSKHARVGDLRRGSLPGTLVLITWAALLPSAPWYEVVTINSEGRVLYTHRFTVYELIEGQNGE